MTPEHVHDRPVAPPHVVPDPRSPADGPTPPPRGLFVTGTDTAVGKTAVACGLLRLLSRRGRRPSPFKPAETGVLTEPHDAVALRSAANRLDLPLSLVCPYTFRQPVAPAAATRSEGPAISLSHLLSAARQLADAGEYLVAESAGGILTPYSDHLTAADLAAALRLPILLVARNSLGTVNHTALAINELHRRALPLAGLVLVDTTPGPSPDRASNAELIASTAHVAPLGVVPYLTCLTADALADALHPLIPEALL